MLLGVMTLIVSIGAFIAFERAEAPTIGGNEQQNMSFSISSSAFKDGERIPSKYTCDGENVNPEIRIQGVPEGTVSLVLVMDDPDIPDSVKQSRGIEKFDHWAVYNIPADTTVIPEGEIVGTGGLNGRGSTAYTGPCPPDREHRYFFRVYALSGTLNFIQAPTLDELEEVAKSSALESATLMGRYERITQ